MFDYHAASICTCENICHLYIMTAVYQVLDGGLARAKIDIIRARPIYKLKLKLKILIGVTQLLASNP